MAAASWLKTFTRQHTRVADNTGHQHIGSGQNINVSGHKLTFERMASLKPQELMFRHLDRGGHFDRSDSGESCPTLSGKWCQPMNASQRQKVSLGVNRGYGSAQACPVEHPKSMSSMDFSGICEQHLDREFSFLIRGIALDSCQLGLRHAEITNAPLMARADGMQR